MLASFRSCLRLFLGRIRLQLLFGFFVVATLGKQTKSQPNPLPTQPPKKLLEIVFDVFCDCGHKLNLSRSCLRLTSRWIRVRFFFVLFLFCWRNVKKKHKESQSNPLSTYLLRSCLRLSLMFVFRLRS